MIKTIIFDLGKVIIPFDLRRGYAAIQPHCSFALDEIPQRIGATDIVRRFESGQITPEDFVRQLSDTLGLRVTYSQFCDMWSSIFMPETLLPEALIEALHRRYRILLLSNTNAIHFELVRERYPILNHFDDYVLSHEVGVMKPHPQIYEETLRRAGCLPQECFFTDDIDVNVDAAREFGIDAVTFRSREQLESELRRRGVMW